MPDLSTELRQYFDATAPPLEVEEVVLYNVVRVPARQTPSRERMAPSLQNVIATMAVVLALIVGLSLLIPAGNGNEVVEPTPTTLNADTIADLETIEAGVAAFYSGDAERAVELFDLTDRTDDEIRQEAAYQAAIGGHVSSDCTGTRRGVFWCRVPYHNAMTDTIGLKDSPGDRFRVVVEDGVITEFAFPEHTGLVAGMGTFLAMEGRFEGYEDCSFGPFTESCAAIQLESLDAWAEWLLSFEPATLVEFALESWYGGDCVSARHVAFIDAPECSLPTPDSTNQMIEYESIMRAGVSLDGCVQVTTSRNNYIILSCEVHYSNAMTTAVGALPSVTVREFAVHRRGAIVHDVPGGDSPWYATHYPEDTELRESFRLFAEGGELRDEYGAANCANERTPRCANLIMDNLDAWASWYQTNS